MTYATLTRDQWDQIWNGLEAIREATDGSFYTTTAALKTVGLDAAAETFEAAGGNIADTTLWLQEILTAAQTDLAPTLTAAE